MSDLVVFEETGDTQRRRTYFHTRGEAEYYLDAVRLLGFDGVYQLHVPFGYKDPACACPSALFASDDAARAAYNWHYEQLAWFDPEYWRRSFGIEGLTDADLHRLNGLASQRVDMEYIKTVASLLPTMRALSL